MKLLSATPSPYARKVRIALAEKGLPFELITEVPWNDDASTPAYNPLEKLPVLILDDGTTVYDSPFILEWLEIRHPEPPLFPSDPDERLAARQLEVLADGVCDAVVLILFERMRQKAHRSAPWIARQRRKVEGGLGEIARLAPAEGFCVGDRFSLADIAVGTVLAYCTLRLPENDWRAAHPRLGALHDRLAARPSFRDTEPAAQPIDPGVV